MAYTEDCGDNRGLEQILNIGHLTTAIRQARCAWLSG